MKATMDKKMISLRVGQYVICMKDTQHKNTEKPDARLPTAKLRRDNTKCRQKNPESLQTIHN